MATQTQLRRGTAAQNNSFTGAVGELSYDTENKSVRVHDGSTAGGIEVLTGNGDISAKTSDGAALTLQTSDTTVTDGSVLGKIEFKAPNEASGTDAILVGAAIEAVAEGTFAADNNATELVFKTGASAAADAKMTLNSSGNLLVGVSSSSANMAGVEIAGNGQLYASTSSSSGHFFNRQSDGAVVSFRKNGTTVGSIGDAQGVATYSGSTSASFGAGDVGLFANPSNNALYPVVQTTLDGSNGLIDLGLSGNRFKDLYLSSSIILKRAESAAVGTFGRNTDGTGRTLFEFRSESQNAVVGKITVANSATAYVTSSDYRLKTDAQPMTGASARVQALNPVNFEWISDGSRVDGFLAHEAATVVPEAVTGTKDAMMDEEYQVSAAKGDIYTPATGAYVDDDGNDVDAVDEVIHSADAEQPETLEDGQQWRETTAAVMGTRSVPDMQGIDQSKMVPLLTAALREALTKIDTMETRVAALEAG